MLRLMNASSWSFGGKLEGHTPLKRLRKRSAFSFVQFVVVPLFVIGVPSGDSLDPLPSILLVKDHKQGWSCRLTFEMKKNQAFFLVKMICLFLIASATVARGF